MKFQIPFQQVLELVKRLTPTQKEKLRQELADERLSQTYKDKYIWYLLHGPVYSEKGIQPIDENRKSIAAWRTKIDSWLNHFNRLFP